jgi:hypothetical protein
VISFSCNKQEKIQSGDPFVGDWSVIVGTWRWTHSDHVYGWCDGDSYSEVIDTLSEGDQYSIEFVEEGIVRYLKNDLLLKESKTFHISFENSSSSEVEFKYYLDSINGVWGGGIGNSNSTNFFRFPFEEEWGCGDYDNYFVKE